MSELKFVCIFNTHIRLKIQNSHWHYKPKFLKNQKSFISSPDLHEKKMQGMRDRCTYVENLDLFQFRQINIA